MIRNKEIRKFIEIIWEHYKEHKRELPWRRTTDPYKILISEVMLQQTQVSRILIKYPEFLQKFPNFYSLAAASLTDLLSVWKGIGYNRRALYLKSLAERVVKEYGGVLPDDLKILATFPGIGPATAASIIVYSFNKPVAFIETNIRRIFIHFFFQDREDVHDKEIFPLVEKTIDKKNPREWYWALMDYGTMLAKTVPNSNRKSKHYVIQSKFEGSVRQLRGIILQLLLTYKKMTEEQLYGFSTPLKLRSKNNYRSSLSRTLKDLVKENFIEEKKGIFRIK